MVTNTNGAGAGSLRQALLDANALPARTDLVHHPGSGPHTITPAAALPRSPSPVLIDGSSEPGFAGSPVIVLNGADRRRGRDGLDDHLGVERRS